MAREIKNPDACQNRGESRTFVEKALQACKGKKRYSFSLPDLFSNWSQVLATVQDHVQNRTSLALDDGEPDTAIPLVNAGSLGWRQDDRGGWTGTRLLRMRIPGNSLEHHNLERVMENFEKPVFEICVENGQIVETEGNRTYNIPSHPGRLMELDNIFHSLEMYSGGSMTGKSDGNRMDPSTIESLQRAVQENQNESLKYLARGKKNKNSQDPLHFRIYEQDEKIRDSFEFPVYPPTKGSPVRDFTVLLQMDFRLPGQDFSESHQISGFKNWLTRHAELPLNKLDRNYPEIVENVQKNPNFKIPVEKITSGDLDNLFVEGMKGSRKSRLSDLVYENVMGQYLDETNLGLGGSQRGNFHLSGKALLKQVSQLHDKSLTGDFCLGAERVQGEIRISLGELDRKSILLVRPLGRNAKRQVAADSGRGRD